jgi:hypothetical protein
MLCLPGRFSFHSMSPGIQARGFDFTAYLTADLFQDMADENREGLVELDPEAIALIEVAKAKLRSHFRQRESERSRSKIQEWKDAKIYPYEGVTSDPIQRNERQVFDAVALNLADYSNDFEKTPPKQQQFILQLIKAAIETGTSTLPAILEKVIDLPKAKQDELADLLRKTTLTAVINAVRAPVSLQVRPASSSRPRMARRSLSRIATYSPCRGVISYKVNIRSTQNRHMRPYAKPQYAIMPSPTRAATSSPASRYRLASRSSRLIGCTVLTPQQDREKLQSRECEKLPAPEN